MENENRYIFRPPAWLSRQLIAWVPWIEEERPTPRPPQPPPREPVWVTIQRVVTDPANIIVFLTAVIFGLYLGGYIMSDTPQELAICIVFIFLVFMAMAAFIFRLLRADHDHRNPTQIAVAGFLLCLVFFVLLYLMILSLSGFFKAFESSAEGYTAVVDSLTGIVTTTSGFLQGAFTYLRDRKWSL